MSVKNFLWLYREKTQRNSDSTALTTGSVLENRNPMTIPFAEKARLGFAGPPGTPGAEWEAAEAGPRSWDCPYCEIGPARPQSWEKAVIFGPVVWSEKIKRYVRNSAGFQHINRHYHSYDIAQYQSHRQGWERILCPPPNLRLGHCDMFRYITMDPVTINLFFK